jgi:hypothetical protein
MACPGRRRDEVRFLGRKDHAPDNVSADQIVISDALPADGISGGLFGFEDFGTSCPRLAAAIMAPSATFGRAVSARSVPYCTTGSSSSSSE